MINCTFKKNDIGFSVSNEKSILYIRPYQDGVVYSSKKNEEKHWNNWLPFYMYRKLHAIVSQSMSDDSSSYWERVCEKRGIDKEKAPYGPPKFHEWFEKKCQKAIAKELANHWNWMIKEKVDPKARQISKRICSITGLNKKHYMSKEVYAALINNTNYLYDDFMKFPACVYVCANSGIYANSNIFFDSKRTRTKIIINKDWMHCYTNSDKVNRPLRKTLMNMPRGINSDTISSLRDTNIKQAIYGRTKLIIVLNNLNHHSPNLDILHKSTNEEILRVARMARYRGLPFNMRKVSSIIDMAGYILDYPERYHGNLKGLFLRSYRWHQNPANIKARTTLPDDHKFPLPPWGEFKSDKVKRISTVGEVKVEGKSMGHCVASYADFCAKGRSFIYHIDYDKDAATIEVTPNGVVKQAYGPRNSKNKAATWGTGEIKRLIKKSKWKGGEDLIASAQVNNDYIPF